MAAKDRYPENTGGLADHCGREPCPQDPCQEEACGQAWQGPCAGGRLAHEEIGKLLFSKSYTSKQLRTKKQLKFHRARTSPQFTRRWSKLSNLTPCWRPPRTFAGLFCVFFFVFFPHSFFILSFFSFSGSLHVRSLITHTDVFGKSMTSPSLFFFFFFLFC